MQGRGRWGNGRGEVENRKGQTSAALGMKTTGFLQLWPPYLYCHHRQDLHGDPIKFIKAAPGTGLSEALIDVAARLQ